MNFKLEDIIKQLQDDKYFFINQKNYWAEIKTLKFSEYIATVNLGILAFIGATYSNHNNKLSIIAIFTAIISTLLALFYIRKVSSENINQLQAKYDQTSKSFEDINKIIMSNYQLKIEDADAGKIQSEIQNELSNYGKGMAYIEGKLRGQEKCWDWLQVISFVLLVASLILVITNFMFR